MTARHLHLDPLGGMSGDMFIGALLDAFPDHAEGLGGALEQAGFPGLVKLECRAHSDGVLAGTRFCVNPIEPESHQHRHYKDIKQLLAESALPAATQARAQDIFRRLAEAEASIHGKPVAEVAFHEVGAWDSIADVVLAAHLAEALDASWSCAPLPLGGGLVETQHGKLPAPAPATSLLLQGFAVHDDGVQGERITPTGAAILASLAPAAARPPGRLGRQGYGFGARTLPGLANALRVTVIEAATAVEENAAWQQDEVCRLSCELDDLTPENLALALERLREAPGVIDVRQSPYSGKKLRQGHAIALLVRPEAEASVIGQLFAETSSLGVRRERLTRAILPRKDYRIEVDGKAYAVKVAMRPSGLTAKADLEELAATGLDLAAREALRARIEAAALAQAKPDFAENTQ